MSTRCIALPDGSTIDIEAMPGLYDAVRKKYELGTNEHISDAVLLRFVIDALNTTLLIANEQQRE